MTLRWLSGGGGTPLHWGGGGVFQLFRKSAYENSTPPQRRNSTGVIVVCVSLEECVFINTANNNNQNEKGKLHKLYIISHFQNEQTIN